MIKLYYILKYEFLKFFKSARGYVLLLTGTVPLIIFLSISADKAHLEFLATANWVAIQNGLLINYIFYSYVLSIFFTIMVFSDIISNEKTYEFLLVSTSRPVILLGKIIITCFLNIILLLETMMSFLLTLMSYDVPFPPTDQILKAYFTSVFICFLLVIPLILFSHTFIIKLGNINSSMANYLAIFVFFVIPFIIYFSLDELQLFRPEMLNYSIHTIVKTLIKSVIIPEASNITTATQTQTIETIGSIGIVGYIASLILFSKSSIIN